MLILKSSPRPHLLHCRQSWQLRDCRYIAMMLRSPASSIGCSRRQPHHPRPRPDWSIVRTKAGRDVLLIADDVAKAYDDDKPLFTSLTFSVVVSSSSSIVLFIISYATISIPMMEAEGPIVDLESLLLHGSVAAPRMAVAFTHAILLSATCSSSGGREAGHLRPEWERQVYPAEAHCGAGPERLGRPDPQ